MKRDVTEVIRRPEAGGVEAFLTGRASRAVARLDSRDPRWKDLRQFEDGGAVGG